MVGTTIFYYNDGEVSGPMKDLNVLVNNQLLFGLSEPQLQMLADVAEE